MNFDDTLVEAAARVMHGLIRQSLDHETLEAIDRENAELIPDWIEGDLKCDALHDYCDGNEYLWDATKQVLNLNEDDYDPSEGGQNDFMNQVHDFASRHGYSREWNPCLIR